MIGRLDIVILGVSMTSSWGHGQSTALGSLVRALTRRGHHVLCLERDLPRDAANGAAVMQTLGHAERYGSVEELKERFHSSIQAADLVIVGSFVPDGVEVGQWVCRNTPGVTAFYDANTPLTVAKLDEGDCPYLTPELVRRYMLYLSCSGGPLVQRIGSVYGAAMARPFYGCFEPELCYPEAIAPIWDLGYIGNDSQERRPRVERLLLAPARQWQQGRFIVVGSQYPQPTEWPGNARHIEHLPPGQHPWFYNRQRFTLNLAPEGMMRAGYSPNVRLFEAAACGTPIISDMWKGLNHLFEIGREILVADQPDDALRYLRDMPDSQRVAIGLRARQRVLTHHTAAHRAAQLEAYVQDLLHAHTPARSCRAQVRTRARRARASHYVKEAAHDLTPWFHNLHMPDGSQTCPDHVLGDFPKLIWARIADHLPHDLSNWNALDIGCNAGFYCFELAKRGAHVLGIDSSDHYLAQARWAARQFDFGDRVEFRKMHIYDMAKEELQFDLVLFMGVFHHLRHPLLGLDIVAEKVRQLMVFQTLTMPGETVDEDSREREMDEGKEMLDPGWPKMAFTAHRRSDPTHWWVPNHAAVEVMLRSAGMRVVHRPAHEFYLCRPDEPAEAVTPTQDRMELLAASRRTLAADERG